MRLGLIIYGSLDTLTGGYIYDKFLVEHLRRKGHELEVLSLPWRNYSCHLFYNFWPKLCAALLKNRYDLILQDELNHPSLFWLNRKLHKHVNAPIVSIVHQVPCSQSRGHHWNSIYRAIEKSYLTSVDAFIFNSKNTHKNVQQLIEVKCPNIIAYPAGNRLGCLHSTREIKSRAYQSGRLRLLFVGNITPNKGLYPLIESLSRLPSKIWGLTVVGSLSMDREYGLKVKRLLSKKDLNQQVRLLGTLNRSGLVRLLSESHLFVMPFSYEGFGIAFLEGMAFGLPAIGSAAGAVKEFIRPGHNGFLIAPHDVASLTRHIENLFHDRDRLVKMSIAAFQTYDNHPQWKDSMEFIHDFLITLTERQPMV